ncbi:hypothetical protein [Rhizobium ruizarguesonis]|uniref:hypothetical protein n=1 Tax=Rhizobium ruizarguesonis TaxID=2081791 RepID=UPI001032418C|nr:hypothetical protein [Rhizobium ruizarguesonis]TBE20555.1 hypothetical protein ELH05_28305 [Rhizobium ruizarguesonis]TCA27807.1 hypothetical protein E0H66_31915 [Rhizobium leguminosarum bv. viciae]WSH23690.1 hypothetical protein U8Q07_25605 [Rhizobium ruizarguesonis]WSH37086.1 hypothetical protein U8P70_28450 [Rhizobium ruizarguesonis]
MKFVAVLSVYVNTRMLQNGAHRTVMGRPNDAGRLFHMAREGAELAEGRFAADQIQNPLVFVRLQAMAGDEFRRDRDGAWMVISSRKSLPLRGFRSLAYVGTARGRKMPAVNRGQATS